jgi:hypothetical protein
MSEAEIKRRLRRATVAAMHGHPEPKHNQIPSGMKQSSLDAAEISLQEEVPVAGSICDLFMQ